MSVLATACRIAKAAGSMVRTAYQSPSAKTVDTKGGMTADLVTETDKAVEEFIFKELRHHFPEHRFIGEETTAGGGALEGFNDAPTWIVDPIDGTTNFVHGFPYVCVSIALAIKKEPVLGVVYNPILDQLFSAYKGQGAHLNGFPISVKSPVPLNQALVAAEHGADRSDDIVTFKIGDMDRLLRDGKIHGLRSLGSAALNLCYVATGGFDVYYEFGVHIWDVAAGIVIVREAGGIVVDTTTKPLELTHRRLLACSHESLAKSISTILHHKDMLPYDL